MGGGGAWLVWARGGLGGTPGSTNLTLRLRHMPAGRGRRRRKQMPSSGKEEGSPHVW